MISKYIKMNGASPPQLHQGYKLITKKNMFILLKNFFKIKQIKKAAQKSSLVLITEIFLL